MELWIRSQDRRILQKVDNVYLNANYENKRICTNDIKDYESDLGEYTTKERALEVLDDIQKCLSSDFTFNGTHEQADMLIKTKMINGLYGVIYEMPKD